MDASGSANFMLMVITYFVCADVIFCRWVSKDGIGAFGRILIGTIMPDCFFRIFYPGRFMKDLI
jgi:hypothetical protein